MTKLAVYDPPMCCSTGVCGPAVDPVLPRVAADLDWLKRQGVQVERYNLAQQPQAFASNPTVTAALREHGNDCLPLVLVDGGSSPAGPIPTARNSLGSAGLDAAGRAETTEGNGLLVLLVPGGGDHRRGRLPARRAGVANYGGCASWSFPVPSREICSSPARAGVGKTSVASATAVGLADEGKRVLLVSTDPASNLDEVFGVELGMAGPRRFPACRASPR